MSWRITRIQGIRNSNNEKISYLFNNKTNRKDCFSSSSSTSTNHVVVRQQQQQGAHRRLPPPYAESSSSSFLFRIPSYIWISFGGICSILGYGYYSHLDSVPYTKRQRLMISSTLYEKRLGDTEFKNLLQQYHQDILPSNHVACQTVQRVGQRIANAAHQFIQQQQQPQQQQVSSNNNPIPYTYTVVRSDVANAFVLPGNHIFVMTGLFQYVADEDELGIILGHEMAHNIARHAGEKMSSAFIMMILTRLLLWYDPSGIAVSVFLPSTTLLRELPNSRIQEIEADTIGLQIAAEACYNPQAAPRVFQKMMNDDIETSSLSSSSSPPEFLSTHPSHHHRIKHFDTVLPPALQRYHSEMGQRCQPIREQMKAARLLALQQQQQKQKSSEQ